MKIKKLTFLKLPNGNIGAQGLGRTYIIEKFPFNDSNEFVCSYSYQGGSLERVGNVHSPREKDAIAVCQIHFEKSIMEWVE